MIPGFQGGLSKESRADFRDYKSFLQSAERSNSRGDQDSALAFALNALKYLKRVLARETGVEEKSSLEQEMKKLRSLLVGLYKSVGEKEKLIRQAPPMIASPDSNPTHSSSFEFCKIEPEDITINMGEGGKIGGSLEGDIYKCDYKNSHCVAKIYKRIEGMKYSEAKETIMRDMLNTLTLNHPNILRYYGYYVKPEPYCSMPETLCLVMDRALMDLGRAIRENLLKTSQDKMSVIMGILSGLIYLHSVGVIHSDLKPENVLLVPGIESGYRAQICDFGLSVIKENRRKAQLTTYQAVGTSQIYTTPEILTTGKVSARSDLFSFASVAYYVLTGNHPICSKNMAAVDSDIKAGKMPRPPLGVNAFWRTIFEKCWKKDPRDRPDDTELYRELQDILRGM